MMHRGRSIFRLLDDVTTPTLGGDGGITSTLQQRHPGSVDLTPLHPILAAARIAPKNTLPKLRACTFTKFRQYGVLVSGFSFSLSLSISLSLLFSSTKLICLIHCVYVCARVISHGWPRGQKGVGRKKTERRSSPISLEEFFKRRHSNRTSPHRWALER